MAAALVTEATLHNVLLKSILKVVTKQRTLVGPIAIVTVHEDDGIVIAPVLSWHVSKLAVDDLELPHAINLANHLVDKVNHKNQHDDVTVAPEYVEGALLVAF